MLKETSVSHVEHPIPNTHALSLVADPFLIRMRRFQFLLETVLRVGEGQFVVVGTAHLL